MEMAKYTTVLNQLRESKGISFAQLGEKLELHPQTIRDKFKSENVTTIIKLLDALGCTVVTEKGLDIMTGKPFCEGEEEKIEIGNVKWTLAEFEEFKRLLNK